jgi:hypothetical protein
MKLKFLPILFALFLIAGCSSMRVSVEQTDDYSFESIKTYQWVNGPDEILGDADTYININIQKALNTQLINRGLKQVQHQDEATIQVAYYVKLKEQQEYAATSDFDEPTFAGGLVYSRNSKSWTYEEREPDLTVYAVEVGTLTVLIYDAGSGKRIWRGNLKTHIDRTLPDEQRQALIHDAAKKLMGHLPPEPN